VNGLLNLYFGLVGPISNIKFNEMVVMKPSFYEIEITILIHGPFLIILKETHEDTLIVYNVINIATQFK